MTGPARDILTKICADKREHVAARQIETPFTEIRQRAADAPHPRDFIGALAARADGGSYPLIAEIKKASPSRGLIRKDFDPAALARIYAENGASCLSVLTDRPYFQGEDAHLLQARKSVDLPILRKDFTVDPYQIFEARVLGADAVLIILAAIPDNLAAELIGLADELGLASLVEIHDRAELDRAVALGGKMIGVNNRNLKTLEVDLKISEELIPALPRNVLAVAESGLGTPEDLARAWRAGARAFLIGERFMREPDVGVAVRAMIDDGPPDDGAGHRDQRKRDDG